LAREALYPEAIWTERKTRADLLMKGRRYNDAATEYRDLLNQVSAADRPPIELAMADAVYRGAEGGGQAGAAFDG